MFVTTILVLALLTHMVMCKQKHNVDGLYKAQRRARAAPNYVQQRNLRERFDEYARNNKQFDVLARRNAQRVRRDTKSPIASVPLPDIQPVLDVITNGAQNIYDQVSNLLGGTLDYVQQVITGVLQNDVPLVERVISIGNDQLKEDIVNAFENAVTQTSQDFAQITEEFTRQASDNITTNNANLLQTLLQILNDFLANLEQTVQNGVSTTVQDVINALTAANQDLYTQIQTLLADPNNTSQIVAQLNYADATAIANLLTSTNNGLYDAIIVLVSDLWRQMQEAIIQSAQSGLEIQEPTLVLWNDALFNSISTNLNNALEQVRLSIENVTADEVQQINNIVSGSSQGLIDDLTFVFVNLEQQIQDIVNTVTAEQVQVTVDLITQNNNAVLTGIVNVLGTA